MFVSREPCAIFVTDIPENHKTYSTTHTTRCRIQTIERGCRQIPIFPVKGTFITILSSVPVPITIQSNGTGATARVFRLGDACIVI